MSARTPNRRATTAPRKGAPIRARPANLNRSTPSPSRSAPATQLRFKEVTAATWKDFEALFESPGAPKYCWCMAWRARGAELKKADSKSRKAMMRKRVKGGVPVGLLGYREGEPIAWCSIAPRPTHRELGGVEVEGEDPDRVWSVVCFFVKRQHRGAGIVRQLLAEACRHAKKKGATAVEAYPVDPDSPSYRFMGFKPVFDEANFEQVGRAGSRRYVMRRTV